jgi:segregation and condensation protein A
MTKYEVRLPVFEGPLDLLLQLIERRQLDITTVSLALVTDQYLDHLRHLRTGAGVDSEQLSEFIAVAAKLLLIKSAALLPRPVAIRPEETPADPTDLTERLRLYEAVRRSATYLRQREAADLRSYPHPPPRNALELVGLAPEPTADARSAQPPSSLVAAFRRALRRPIEPSAELPRETWTVAEAIVWLRDLVHNLSGGLSGGLGRGLGQSTFGRLTAGLDRERVVAAFLALLELHRLGKVRAGQAEAFGEIDLAPGDTP